MSILIYRFSSNLLLYDRVNVNASFNNTCRAYTLIYVNLCLPGFIACCSVHTPSSNPNKPPARTLPRALTLRRSQRNNPTAPNYGRPGYNEPPLPSYDTAVRDGRGGRTGGPSSSLEMR